MVKNLNDFYEKSGEKKRFKMGSETLGDGNCFYRAVIDYLALGVEGLTSGSHLELRRTVVADVEKEFKKDPQSEEMQQFVAAFKPDSNASTFSEAIEKQKLDGTFATFEFICYTAATMETSILVLKIEEDGSVREEFIPSKLNTASDGDINRPIIIAHKVKIIKDFWRNLTIRIINKMQDFEHNLSRLVDT